jgi:TrmH family RNA methyltransferase
MLSKANIKDIQSLQQKKYRQAAGLFVAEGPKVVHELLCAGSFIVEAIYATADWSGWNMLDQYSIDSKICTVVPDFTLEKIAFYSTPNQVVALFRIPQQTESPDINSILLVLDHIQDPGNLGTIIRSADWFGISQIICSTDTTDVYAPKVVQSTMASLGRVQIHYLDLHPWMLNQKGKVPIWTTHMKGAQPNKVLSGKKEGMLIIGNESHGVNPLWHDLSDDIIAIPQYGAAESLNAAVAASILMYAIRQ